MSNCKTPSTKLSDSQKHNKRHTQQLQKPELSSKHRRQNLYATQCSSDSLYNNVYYNKDDVVINTGS